MRTLISGEVCQRTYEMLFNVYAYCDAIIFGMLCRFDLGESGFAPTRRQCVVIQKNRRCGQCALRRIIKKCAMRILRANQVSPLQNWYPIIYIHNDMINSVRYAELGEACLARKKHIITCSGAPRHAVIEPRRMAAVSIISPM